MRPGSSPEPLLHTDPTSFRARNARTVSTMTCRRTTRKSAVSTLDFFPALWARRLSTRRAYNAMTTPAAFVIDFVDAFKKSRWVKYRYMTGGNVGFRSDGKLIICEEGNETSED